MSFLDEYLITISSIKKGVSKALFLLVFLSIQGLYSQTSVGGTVFDQDGFPVAFADIYFEGSLEGCLSDEKGHFQLNSDKNYNKVIISFVGFSTKKITLKSSRVRSLRITLIQGENLKEVVVVAPPKKRIRKKENPAYPIMKKVWALVGKSGLEKTRAYQYKKYKSVETGINNVDTSFVKTILGVYESNKIIQTIKKNNNRGADKLFVPLNIKEDVVNVYADNILKKKKIDIEAERKTGVKMQNFIFDRAGVLFNTVEVYQNNFQLLRKSFVSPISKSGFATYDYVLHDSIQLGDTISNNKRYTIYFFPRRATDMAFEGYFKVETPSYAVTEIDMKLNKANAINLVNGLYLSKKYEVINDSVFVPKESSYDMEYSLFTKSDKEKSIYVHLLETYQDYIFNQPKEEAFYNQITQKVSAKQFEKTNKYWDSTDIDDNNAVRLAYLGKVKNNKKVTRSSELINSLLTGYFPLIRNVRWGRYWNTLQGNDVEGLRLNFGLRSFKSIDDRWVSIGFLGYGISDKKFKYNLETRYLISNFPRIIVRGQLINDYRQLSGTLIGRSQTIVQEPFLNVTVIRRGKNFFLTNVIKKNIGADFKLAPNLHLGIELENQQMKSAAPDIFDIGFSEDNTNIRNEFDVSTFSSYLAFTPGRIPLGLGAIQRFSRILYPTLLIKYTRSDKNAFSDFDFNKVMISYEHPILLGSLGIFRPTIQVGKTFGTLPITLLTPIPASQSIAPFFKSFALLNYYDFVTDSYALLFLKHSFEGFILNKIPLLKKLKWRSSIFLKGAYGTISDENIAANKGNIIYNAPSDRYWEYGFELYNIGIGNFRFFRLQFVWGSDLPDNFVKNKNTLSTSSFGVRLGFVPEF